jgi:glycosyltransferase involved in cell wall biosynthesis/SAM-dependent methyltransferase
MTSEAKLTDPPLITLNERPANSPPAGAAAGPALVSVIIPCYNHARFLPEAIDSALRQTWRPLEIIVVDDGSTDGTAEVIERYSGVIGITQANQGLSAARNSGLDVSQGRYVAFLDADDLLLPGAIEAGVRELSSHPECAFVSGAYRDIDIDGKVIGGTVYRDAADETYLALLRGNYIGMHATVLYRRDVLKQVGGFDPALSACEDYDAYLRIARQFPIRQHYRVVAEYRKHVGNMSRDSERMMAAALAVLERQRPHLGTERDRRRAYRAGRRFWRDTYSRQLFRQSLDRLREPQGRRDGLRGLSRVIELSPPEFVRSSTKSLLRTGMDKVLPLLPPTAQDWLRLRRRTWRCRPPVGLVRWGSLRRVTPISRTFGFDRGRPVDRVYIEGFLERHADDVRGRVLEIGDNAYTRRFGGDRVTRSDVLNVEEGNSDATFVGDLAHADHIPSDAFDCVVITQTLQYVYDLRAGLATLYRILKPSGVVLATVPCISPLERFEGRDEWFWPLTPGSAERLFKERFPADRVKVEAHGNILAAVCLLHGLACEEVDRVELEKHDERYPIVIAIRAVKPAEA